VPEIVTVAALITVEPAVIAPASETVPASRFIELPNVLPEFIVKLDSVKVNGLPSAVLTLPPEAMVIEPLPLFTVYDADKTFNLLITQVPAAMLPVSQIASSPPETVKL
jgi:hypothetical protein